MFARRSDDRHASALAQDGDFRRTANLRQRQTALQYEQARLARHRTAPIWVSPTTKRNVMSTQHPLLIILGSGPAGHTAPVHAARAHPKPTLPTALEVGGPLLTTTDIANCRTEARGVGQE